MTMLTSSYASGTSTSMRPRCAVRYAASNTAAGRIRTPVTRVQHESGPCTIVKSWLSPAATSNVMESVSVRNTTRTRRPDVTPTV